MKRNSLQKSSKRQCEKGEKKPAWTAHRIYFVIEVTVLLFLPIYLLKNRTSFLNISLLTGEMLLVGDSEMESRLFQEARKQRRTMLASPSSLYGSSADVTIVQNQMGNDSACL